MQSKDTQKILDIFKKILRRRKLLIFLCILGVLAPIIYFNETTSPTYESSTMIIFEEFAPPVPTYNFDSSREIFIYNRLEEIKSLSFAEDIAKALPKDTIKKFRLPKDRPEYFDKLGYISGKIQKSISAYPVRNSNIVRISIEMRDPYLCMTVANTAAQVFEERNYKIKQEGVSGVRKFIENQLERFRKQLDESEQSLKRFKKVNRITSFDKESAEILRRMTEAEVLYNNVKANRGSTEERLSAIQQKLAQQKKELVLSITDIATPSTQRLKEKLTDLELQYTELSVQDYSPDHPKMVQLKNDIEQTKKSLAAEALKLVKRDNIVDPIAQMEKYLDESFTLQIELETLKARESALKNVINKYDQALRSLPDKEFQLARLTRERDVSQKIYMSLLEKREEARISEAEKFANIRIIDKARFPDKPIKPRKKLNLAIGMLLGLLVGGGLAFLLEISNPSLESSEALEELTQWSVLASIPKLEMASDGKMTLRKRSNNRTSKEPSVKRGLITNLEPKSGAAEVYRMLRTNLQFLGIGQTYKTILITSFGPEDGKSTTLANLALTLATSGENILLLDADLRRPTLHSIFDLVKEPGLSELLVNQNTIKGELLIMDEDKASLGNVVKQEGMGDLVDNFSDFVLDSNFVSKVNDLNGTNDLNIINNVLIESIQFTKIENLKVLTSGKRLQNPSETISTMSMRALLENLKEKFSVILIDSAPLLLVPETMVLSALVDGVLFVVDASKFNEEMILKSKSLLDKAKANVLGAVLNNLERANVYESTYYYA